MTVRIPLSKGKIALLDDADAALVAGYRWCATDQGGGRWYAVAHVPRSGASGHGGRTIYMHRLIFGDAVKGLQVDHIDHDGLNNRRRNLRVVTQHGNMQNRRGANRNSGTGHRNVYRTWVGTYNVKMQLGRKFINIGSYQTLEEAIAAASEGRRRYMPSSPENLEEVGG